MHKSSIFFTDLDGTLLNSDNKISPTNISALRNNQQQSFNVAVTGRSLHAVKQVLNPDSPFDFIVTSIGAGIFSWPKQELLFSSSFNASDTANIIQTLLAENADFMLHDLTPNNHHWHYHLHNPTNTDFIARNKKHHQYITALNSNFIESPSPISQALIVSPAKLCADTAYQHWKHLFPQYSIIRSTSPIDLRSTWFEILPKRTSKSHACQWICDYLQIPQQKTMAIGNDYNDLDMLEWAGVGFMVANGPEAMKHQFLQAPRYDQDGVAAALTDWRRKFNM